MSCHLFTLVPHNVHSQVRLGQTSDLCSQCTHLATSPVGVPCPPPLCDIAPASQGPWPLPLERTLYSGPRMLLRAFWSLVPPRWQSRLRGSQPGWEQVAGDERGGVQPDLWGLFPSPELVLWRVWCCGVSAAVSLPLYFGLDCSPHATKDTCPCPHSSNPLWPHCRQGSGPSQRSHGRL